MKPKPTLAALMIAAIIPNQAIAQDAPANTVSANTGSSAVVNSYAGTPNLAEAVPTVIMPGLSNTPETCAVSNSVSGVFSGIGIGVGRSRVDKGCNIRMYAKLMAQLGDPEAAKAMLCSDKEVALAYSKAGRPCPNPPEK